MAQTPELIDQLEAISNVFVNRSDDFTPKQKEHYLQLLTELTQNLQSKLISLSRATGSVIKFVQGTQYTSSFEDEPSYSLDDLKIHIDDCVFSASTNSFDDFINKHLAPIGKDVAYIGYELSVFGEQCVSGKYCTLDEVKITITSEKIDISAKVQVRQTKEFTVSI